MAGVHSTTGSENVSVCHPFSRAHLTVLCKRNTCTNTKLKIACRWHRITFVKKTKEAEVWYAYVTRDHYFSHDFTFQVYCSVVEMKASDGEAPTLSCKTMYFVRVDIMRKKYCVVVHQSPWGTELCEVACAKVICGVPLDGPAHWLVHDCKPLDFR